MPLPALAIAGLATGGLKALAGGIQALFPGQKVAEPKPYEIPQEAKERLSRAREAELTGMPEVSMMMGRQAAQQAALFGMRASQDRRGGLANISNVQAGLFRAYGDLAQRDAEIRQRNFMLTQEALSAMERAKNLKFQTDYMRYQNAEQRRRANIGAGLQNIMGGLDLAGFVLGSTAFGTGNKTTDTTKPPTQTGRGLAGGPSMSDYLATSPFNTSIGEAPSVSSPIYDTRMNSYMPGSYGALMGTPSIPASTPSATGSSSFPFFGTGVANFLSGQMFNRIKR